ncbi:fish-egg lectin-like [Anoplopoma fimbria]|uniref:fish-egg lectin-like n=1 Tax=Anoplopoma fimbria TaxID=229290 RepID=UPI0023EACD92|nr:fish-egg lectin-like [Anoplopoma fimbria]
MKGIAAFLLVLCYLAISDAAWTCTEAPRLYNVQQVDAGQGKVVVRDSNYYTYFLGGYSWYKLSTTRLRHVSVGPAGLWGTGTDNRVYKYVAGQFLPSSGVSMLQVDAGGDDQVVGVTPTSYAYCLRSASALAYSGVGTLSWSYLSRRLRYFSCSPQNGCWGVDTSYRVYYSVKPSNCGHSGWRVLNGRLKMVEVGTDGRVFGVNTAGQVFERAGISSRIPYGTSWVTVPMCMSIRHVSYDLRKLWVVTNSGLVMHCKS